MKKNKEKANKKVIIIFSIIIAIILIFTVLCVIIKKASNKKVALSDFEKVAVYGYLEDYLSLDKLYLISGSSSYNNVQYSQAKIKEILDTHYSENNETAVLVETILSELSEKYGISDDDIDFRAIVISDYEYSENENAFIRKEGVNTGVSGTETEINDISQNKTLSFTNIEKFSNDTFKVYFNVVDSNNSENILETGVVTIKVIDNSYSIENCEFNK